jgi:hypothetical protein
MVLDCAQAGADAGATANAAVPASTPRLVNFIPVSPPDTAALFIVLRR